MSETSEPSTIPDHWAHTPPAPRETRYLCLLDGTTIEGSDARRRHDEHFHAKTEAGRPEPYVDEAMLRREALSEAARVARGDETPQQLVERAQAFEAFLRGDPVAAVTSVFGEGSDLDVLEGLLAFVRTRTFEDASGLRSLEGVEVQAEAASYLEPVSHEQLRMMAHVLGVASTLVRSAERGKR